MHFFSLNFKDNSARTIHTNFKPTATTPRMEMLAKIVTFKVRTVKTNDSLIFRCIHATCNANATDTSCDLFPFRIIAYVDYVQLVALLQDFCILFSLFSCHYSGYTFQLFTVFEPNEYKRNSCMRRSLAFAYVWTAYHTGRTAIDSMNHMNNIMWFCDTLTLYHWVSRCMWYELDLVSSYKLDNQETVL